MTKSRLRTKLARQLGFPYNSNFNFNIKKLPVHYGYRLRRVVVLKYPSGMKKTYLEYEEGGGLDLYSLNIVGFRINDL